MSIFGRLTGALDIADDSADPDIEIVFIHRSIDEEARGRNGACQITEQFLY